MKINFFITKNGVLKRKQNTVYFIRKDENGNLDKRVIPIEKIYAIFAHGKLSFTSSVVSYLAKYHVPIHFFNKYGFYEGSFYPREYLLSGDLLVKQVNHYVDLLKRLELAKEFIKGCGENIIKNLQYYDRTGKDTAIEIKTISDFIKKIDFQSSINEILSIEGNIWNTYYQAFNKFVPKNFQFDSRSKQPPENMINCLISFGNSLLYSTVLTEIYNTQLNPTISYLHEPSERRFSLSLDISEVFKPLIVDRVIFKLINKNIIQQHHFVKEMNSCLLNDAGRKLFLETYDEKLKTTIKHRDLGRNVSYQRLIRLECYKLIKHLLELSKYKAFRIWW